MVPGAQGTVAVAIVAEPLLVAVGHPPARRGPCVAHHQLRARGLQPDPRAAARRRAGADGVPAARGGPRPRAGGNRRPADRPARRDEQQRDRAARPSADGVPAPDGGLTMARIIVSGARPTGRQHLGNYHGALKNWLRLQGEHRCFFFVADWHALTTDWAAPEALEENTLEMVLDWLAVGLDPARATLFQQSAVKEHAELYLLLGMLTPVPWLERNPTYTEPRAAPRPRRPERLPGLPVLPSPLLHARGAALPGGGLSHRRHRLPRVQADHDQARAGGAGAHPRPARAPHARRRARRARGRQRAGACRGGGDHGASARGGRPVSAPCTVRLPIFEGPLDLLLHLIKKNEVQITDIPIATITA